MTQDFWSRRKAQVAAEVDAESKPADDVQPDPELTDAEVLAALDLPDPDTLMSADDVKRFMAKAVPEHLRRRALRKLWRMNPVLACLDGLNDYDDDYTDKGLAPVAVKTAYQVGKGLMSHIEKLASDEKLMLSKAENTEEHQPVVKEDPPVITQAQPMEQADQEPAIVRRRMRFDFDSGAQA